MEPAYRNTLRYVDSLLAILHADEDVEREFFRRMSIFAKRVKGRYLYAELNGCAAYQRMIGSTSRVMYQFDFPGEDSVVHELERMATDLVPREFAEIRTAETVSHES